jgi:hypothetical protein
MLPIISTEKVDFRPLHVNVFLEGEREFPPLLTGEYYGILQGMQSIKMLLVSDRTM